MRYVILLLNFSVPAIYLLAFTQIWGFFQHPQRHKQTKQFLSCCSTSQDKLDKPLLNKFSSGLRARSKIKFYFSQSRSDSAGPKLTWNFSQLPLVNQNPMSQSKWHFLQKWFAIKTGNLCHNSAAQSVSLTERGAQH